MAKIDILKGASRRFWP